MFSAIPFLKLFIALSIGIIFSVFFDLNIDIYFVIISFTVLLFIHLLANGSSQFIPFYGSILIFFIITIGIYRTTAQKTKIKQFEIPKQSVVLGKILKTPKVYDKFVKTRLRVRAIIVDDKIRKNEGKCLLMIEKDSLSLDLEAGDDIQFLSDLKEVETQGNPHSFNYKRYLFFQQISQQAYLKSEQWDIINIEKHWSEKTSVPKLRLFLLLQYQEHGINGNELAVLSALTLGYKNDLDANIQKSYAASGAIHILAVSGLHVGIVFVIISHLLKFLGKSNRSRWIRFLLILAFIWFFALLTGGSPSVLRATVMLSFVAFGMALKRNGSIYNSIFASAFILLLFDPFLLFNLSFQLSYSAVISIIYFQPKIYKLVEVNNLLSKWTWGLISVSLAAQMGTLPITIYYFHQFPNYFLLSNFIVIPVATAVIWLSLIFFISLSISGIPMWIAFALKYIIKTQNYLIQQIEALPYALSQDLFIDNIQVGFSILIILGLMLIIHKANFQNWFIFGSLILALIVYSNYNLLIKQNQKKLIVYNIKGHTAINFIDSDHNILISSLGEKDKQIDFHISTNWLSLGLNKVKHFQTSDLDSISISSHRKRIASPHYSTTDQFIQFFDKRILFIDNKDVLSAYKKQMLELDYIIIGNNACIDISELNQYFKSKQIVIDSSNSFESLQVWKTQRKLNPEMHIHIVSENGAFIEDIITS